MNEPELTDLTEEQLAAVDSGQELFTLKGHIGGVRSVAFSPDCTRIVTDGQDRTARLWHTGTGQEVLALKGLTDAVYLARASPATESLMLRH